MAQETMVNPADEGKGSPKYESFTIVQQCGVEVDWPYGAMNGKTQFGVENFA